MWGGRGGECMRVHVKVHERRHKLVTELVRQNHEEEEEEREEESSVDQEWWKYDLMTCDGWRWWG